MSRQESWSRRGRRTAVCAMAGAIVVAAAACGSSSGGAEEGAGMELTVTTPDAVGDVDRVRWALATGEPRTLDPIKSGDYSDNTVVLNVCEPLMRVTPDFAVEPGLAESVAQPDPTTIVFTIREDVAFWNGNPLTAADVVYSLERNLDPSNAPVAAQLFRNVAGITETGPLQVTVELSVPDNQFLNTMASVVSAVSEKAYVEQVDQSYGAPQGGLMCTGPFELAEWAAGDRITLHRNDDYWGERAKAERFEFVFFTDDSTLTSALLAGEVDGTYEAPVASLNTLRNAQNGSLYFGPSTQSLSVGPVSSSGPAADPRVRQAIDLAIDKTALIDTVLNGAGEPLKTFTPPMVWEGDPAADIYRKGYDDLPDYTAPDLDAATALIAEAGAEGATLTLTIPSGDQLGLRTATVVQAAVKDIGLEIVIKQLQPTQFSELFYLPERRADVDLVVASGYIEVPGAYFYAPAFVLPDGFFNWTGWSDDEVTQMMTEGAKASDPVEAAERFVAAQAIFAEANLQISLASTYQLLFMNERITGAPASFAYISSPWAASVGKAE